jgi:hypothetical protein
LTGDDTSNMRVLRVDPVAGQGSRWATSGQEVLYRFSGGELDVVAASAFVAQNDVVETLVEVLVQVAAVILTVAQRSPTSLSNSSVVALRIRARVRGVWARIRGVWARVRGVWARVRSMWARIRGVWARVRSMRGRVRLMRWRIGALVVRSVDLLAICKQEWLDRITLLNKETLTFLRSIVRHITFTAPADINISIERIIFFLSISTHLQPQQPRPPSHSSLPTTQLSPQTISSVRIHARD